MSYINLSFTSRYVAHPPVPPHAHGFDYGMSREGGRPDHVSLTFNAPGTTELTQQPLPLIPSLAQSAAEISAAMLEASGVDNVVVTHAGTGHPNIVSWTSRFGDDPRSTRVTEAPRVIRDLIAAAEKFQPVVDAELRSMQK